MAEVATTEQLACEHTFVYASTGQPYPAHGWPNNPGALCSKCHVRRGDLPLNTSLVVVDEEMVIDHLLQKRRGRRRYPNMETIADVKKAFFTPELLTELLGIELKIARNRKEDVEIFDKEGNSYVVKRRPYDGRVQQAAAADLLSRGGIIKVTALADGRDKQQGLIINIIEEYDDEDEDDSE
jgi:hypothetical protein